MVTTPRAKAQDSLKRPAMGDEAAVGGSAGWSLSMKCVLAAGLIAAVAFFCWQARTFWHYINDDAYITFRYSRFLALGRGPYFNVGEHVEGYTNFLLMLMVAPVIRFFGPDAAAPFVKWLSVLCGCACVALSGLLALRLDRGRGPASWRSVFAALVAAGIVAASPAYALNAASGLETLLYSFLLTAAAALALWGEARGQWMGSGVLFAAAAWTRPEGALMFAAFWLALAASATGGAGGLLAVLRQNGWGGVWRHPSLRGLLLPDGLIVTAAFAAQMVFRLIAYDGEWLPNTYYAKAGGFWGSDRWTYIQDGSFGPIIGVVGAGAALIGWALSSELWRAASPLAALAGVGAFLPVVTGSDWMPGWRMVIPFLPLMAAWAAIGWCQLVGAVIPIRGGWGAALVLAAAPYAWHEQWTRKLLSGRELLQYTQMRARGYETGHRAMAHWLRDEAAKPGNTIALMDIGIVGYECIDQSILDITGLTDRFIARSPGAFLAKHYDAGYVLDRKPEFIVIVLRRNGDGDRPLPPRTELFEWTPIEHKIRQHTDFRRHYRDERLPLPGDGWLARLACEVGAERVFEHKIPELYYLLAVYKRRG